MGILGRRQRLRLPVLQNALHLRVEFQTVGKAVGKGQAAVAQQLRRACTGFQQKAEIAVRCFGGVEFVRTAELRVGVSVCAQHDPRRLGTSKGEQVLAEHVVVHADARKVGAGLAEVFLADPDKNIAQHVLVPKRASAVLRPKHAFAVVVRHELAAHFFAQLTLNGLIKRLCFAVNVNIPVLAAAVLAAVGDAAEGAVKARKNFLHIITSLYYYYSINKGVLQTVFFLKRECRNLWEYIVFGEKLMYNKYICTLIEQETGEHNERQKQLRLLEFR